MTRWFTGPVLVAVLLTACAAPAGASAKRVRAACTSGTETLRPNHVDENFDTADWTFQLLPGQSWRQLSDNLDPTWVQDGPTGRGNQTIGFTTFALPGQVTGIVPRIRVSHGGPGFGLDIRTSLGYAQSSYWSARADTIATRTGPADTQGVAAFGQADVDALQILLMSNGPAPSRVHELYLDVHWSTC